MSNTSAALELRLLLKETMNGATRACMPYLNVMIWIVQGVAPRVLSDSRVTSRVWNNEVEVWP